MAIVLAIVGGGAWLIGSEFLASWIPGMPTMKVSTASMIGLQAVGLLAMRYSRHPSPVVLVTSAITLLAALYFILNPVNTPQTPVLLLAPSQATSITAGLLALAQLLHIALGSAWLTGAALALASLLSLHRLTTFVIGHGTLQTTGPFDSMSLPTSLALFMLAIGLLFHPSLPYAGQLIATSLQGRILRTTLPWALIAPSVVAVMLTLGVEAQWYNTDFVVVSVTASLSVLMIVLLWLLTNKLQHLDDVRAAIHRELSLSEQYANQLIEASPDAMVVIDRHGKILRANAQAEQVFGYPADTLGHMRIDELLPERLRSRHPHLVRTYFDNPTPRYLGGDPPLWALHRDGREIPVDIALAPVDSVHGPIVLANVIDISDRLRKEEQLRSSLEEKTLLLNEIHHRVKNNLQIVASLLNLQSGFINDPHFTALIAESEGRVRAMSLLHQILYERNDFSHVELDVYLQRLVDLQMQIHRSNSRRVTLHTEFDSVRLDLTQAIPLGQAVNELLSNAFKHAFKDIQEGHLWITLKADDKQRARLVVRDNGPGFTLDPNENKHGLGTQLVIMLCDQIGATVRTTEGPGGRAEIEFDVVDEDRSRKQFRHSGGLS